MPGDSPSDRSISHDSRNLKPGFHVPSKTSAIGMLLFLASLFMLFAAGMLGYALVRTSASASGKLPAGSLHVPSTLWISTAIVIVASITIQHAMRQISRQRIESFRSWLRITLLLAIGFVLVQAPSMAQLYNRHLAIRRNRVALYGMVLFLILLHALHVLGGIVALLLTNRQAGRGVYDHEHYQPVRHVALYWHFLDAVWLVMFFTFLLMG